MKKVAAIFLLIVLISCFAACSPTEHTAQGFSMGSDYYVIYQSNVDLDGEISDLLTSLEESFSTRVTDSVISRINSADEWAPIALSEEQSSVLARVFVIAEVTDGAFDPAILPLVKAWGFDPPYRMNQEVPPAVELIAQAKAASSRSYFILNEGSLSKTRSDASLDLGAAIKGYAAERIAAVLTEKEVREALVYVGGTITAVGRPYEIGITPPRDSTESFAARFTLEAGEICATSGDYERFYTYEGKRYHHILDARTGCPADSGVISATVISEDGLLADAIATAIVVLGQEKGIELLKLFGVKGILITSEKKVVSYGVTPVIKDNSYVLA